MRVALMFRCITKGEQVGGPNGTKMGTAKLGPYLPKETDPNYAEMKSFYAWTPGGSLDLATINESALAEFEVGADYRITIEKVVPEAAST